MFLFVSVAEWAVQEPQKTVIGYVNVNICRELIFVNKKGKSVPLQAWSEPERSRKLRFPDFMTTAQDGGTVVSLTHWPLLPPGNASGTHFC